MRNQKQINFQKLIDSVDFICEMCDEFNSIKCKECQLNIIIQKNKSAFTAAELKNFTMPWNGIISENEQRTFEFGEDV